MWLAKLNCYGHHDDINTEELKMRLTFRTGELADATDGRKSVVINMIELIGIRSTVFLTMR